MTGDGANKGSPGGPSGSGPSPAGGGMNKKYYPNATTNRNFQGACEELKGEIFDCSGYGQADQYVRTKNHLANYVGRTLGGAIRIAVEKLVTPVITGPPPPTGYDTGNADPADKYIWETEIMGVSRQRAKVKEQIQQMYSIVLGQCTDAMIARIEAHMDYPTTSEKSDGVALLKIIKSVSFYFHDQKYAPQSIHEQKRQLFSIKQSQHETVTHYYERFHNAVQVLEQCGGTIGTDPGVVQLVCTNLRLSTSTTDPGEVRKITEAVHEYTMAVAFLLGADPARFGTMMREYENAFTNGHNEWPKTLNEAHRRLYIGRERPEHP